MQLLIEDSSGNFLGVFNHGEHNLIFVLTKDFQIAVTVKKRRAVFTIDLSSQVICILRSRERQYVTFANRVTLIFTAEKIVR
jgi:hypothetical protein